MGSDTELLVNSIGILFGKHFIWGENCKENQRTTAIHSFWPSPELLGNIRVGNVGEYNSAKNQTYEKTSAERSVAVTSLSNTVIENF